VKKAPIVTIHDSLSTICWLFLGSFAMIQLFLQQAAFAQESLYAAKGKRDPFVPLVTMETKQVSSGLMNVESVEEIVLEGIVYTGDKESIVVASGSVMKEGEEIGNVKVLKITSDGATFSVNGMEAYKPLYQSLQQEEVTNEK